MNTLLAIMLLALIPGALIYSIIGHYYVTFKGAKWYQSLSEDEKQLGIKQCNIIIRNAKIDYMIIMETPILKRML